MIFLFISAVWRIPDEQHFIERLLRQEHLVFNVNLKKTII